jgi:hypothetical protein
MVFLSEKLAQNGGYCPVCGNFFRPNGVGPQDDRMLSSMLSLLPSSHILKFGANYHDWFFHLGKNWGSQEQADYMMFTLNEVKIREKCKWWNAWYYRTMNKRNYLFVREFGHNYWDKDNCRL